MFLTGRVAVVNRVGGAASDATSQLKILAVRGRERGF